MTNDAAYAYCLRLERDRERKHRRDSRQGRFESEIASTDALVDRFDDPDDLAVLSDRGTGVERILAQDENPAAARRRKIDHAAQKLRRAGLGELVPVLLLVYKNGNNRKESIWELSKR